MDVADDRPTVWPVIRYANPLAAIQFLKEAFGFEEALVVPGDAEASVAHAELRWPGAGGVMIGTAAKPIPASVYVVVSNPDEVFQRAKGAGAKVVLDISDEDYGSRGFSVRDPEGNTWSFGTYRGA